MPQMKPMMWLMMMMMTLSMILLTMILNFFSSIETKYQLKNKKIYPMKWKW